MRRYPSAPKFGTLVHLLLLIIVTVGGVARVRSTPLRRVLFGALAALSMSTCLSLIAHAQSAGPNVNVLPIVLPTDPNSPASVLEAALIGDLYLNRQVEPAIA